MIDVELERKQKEKHILDRDMKNMEEMKHKSYLDIGMSGIFNDTFILIAYTGRELFESLNLGFYLTSISDFCFIDFAIN